LCFFAEVVCVPDDDCEHASGSSDDRKLLFAEFQCVAR
jgi:hypothetical protein